MTDTSPSRYRISYSEERTYDPLPWWCPFGEPVEGTVEISVELDADSELDAWRQAFQMTRGAPDATIEQVVD